MSTIITRAGKGSPLTNTEVDSNFTNLNTDKVEKTAAAITGGTIDGTTIGTTTPASGAFTSVTGTSGVISANSAGDALRITQIGTGNALVVEDEANPDATPFVITSVGSVGIGTAPGTANYLIIGTGSATTQYTGIQLNAKLAYNLLGANGFRANIQTYDGFSYTNVNHFYTQNMVLGAGTTAANQVGFRANGLTAATNNYGFYGDIAAGTGRAITFAQRTTNVVTITTSVAHGYTAGQSVTVAAVTNTSVNGTFTIASVPTTTTFTYAQTGTDITLVADTGTTVVVGRYNFYANGTAPNYFAGAVGIGTATPSATLEVATGSASSVTRATTATQGSYVIAAASDYYSAPSYRGTQLIQWNASATGTTLGLSNANLGVLSFQNVSSAAITTNGSNVLRIGTLAATAISIASNQIVSIGAAPGAESLRVTPVTSAVNYWQFYGGATSNNIAMYATGSDTNIGADYVSKGTGRHAFFTNSPSSVLQFAITNTASAVNYLQVTGGATGNPTVISAQGSDANVSIYSKAKGTGFIVHQSDAATYFQNLSGATQFIVGNVASAVNYLNAYGGATGNVTGLSAQGSDADISIAITPKGTGGVGIGTTAPVSKLDVYAASGYVDARVRSGSNQTYVATDGTASYFGTYSNIPIIFSTNNTERMRVDASGNVGIGTSIPAQKLQVSSTGDAVALVSGGSASAGYMAVNGNARSSLTGATTLISYNSGVAELTNRSNSYFAFGTNSTEYARIGSTGIISLAGAPGAESLRVTPVASAVNYVQIQGAAAAGTPAYLALGSDTNINLYYGTKGTGSHLFATGVGLTQFAIAHTASAVNYMQVTGGDGTTTSPGISLQGSSANITGQFYAKGTGIWQFFTNASEQFRIANTASAVNYLQATGSAAGTRVTISAQGSDTSLGINYIAKGAEGHVFFSHNGAAIQMYVSPTASAVNYLQVTGAATTVWPIISAQGTDANIGLVYRGKGSSGHLFQNASGANQFSVAITNSAVNYLQVVGNVTGSGPVLGSQGTDTNINIGYVTKGTGLHAFATGGGIQFQVVNTASAVNYFQVTGAPTSGTPTLYAAGSDTDVSAVFTSKGGGNVQLRTGTGNQIQFVASHTASAVNYLNVTGNITGAAPYFSAQGSDTNISLGLVAKGTGVIEFWTGGGSFTRQFRVGNTTSAVNYVEVTGAITGSSPTVYAFGSDTNINLALAPKGNGNVLIGRTNSTNVGSNTNTVAGLAITADSYIHLARSNSATKLIIQDTSNRSGTYATFVSGSAVTGSIDTNGTTTTYTTSSDYRLKDNPQPMQDALDTVAQLNPVTWTWKTDGSAGQGFIAHELQSVVPDCVIGEKDGVDADGNPKYQGVDTSFLVATLTKAIQEQQAIIQSQQATIQALDARLSALEAA